MDLSAYFERIAYTGSARADVQTLRDLHLLHPLAIPFENLSTLIGEPVPLDIDALEDKLVTRQRGGYCFEQNSLFQAVLETIGFSVTALAARVVWNERAGFVNPRTHMVMLVDIGSTQYVADVGFGGATLTAPLELVEGAEQQTPHEVFRIVRRKGDFEVQVRIDDTWRPTYVFDLQAQWPVDYEVLNHYVATHPGSPFRSRLMAARPTEDRRYALGNRQLSIHREGRTQETRELESAEAIKDALTRLFRIRVPEDPRLDAALDIVLDRVPDRVFDRGAATHE